MLLPSPSADSHPMLQDTSSKLFKLNDPQDGEIFSFFYLALCFHFPCSRWARNYLCGAQRLSHFSLIWEFYGWGHLAFPRGFPAVWFVNAQWTSLIILFTYEYLPLPWRASGPMLQLLLSSLIRQKAGPIPSFTSKHSIALHTSRDRLLCNQCFHRAVWYILPAEVACYYMTVAEDPCLLPL